jgi:sulfate adenylyltransferase subunit 2
MSLGSGIPKNQRPELWNIYNGRKQYGEHFRVFPISNWTEMDVWNYIRMENIPLPSIYFTHKRLCLQRDGVILAYADFMPLKPGEQAVEMQVRFRTIGDISCTGAVVSDASNLDEVIDEITVSKFTERGTRFDDKRSDTAMEDRKKAGYF